MAKRSKKSMFRDFKMRNPETVNRSYLKYFRLAQRDMSKNYDVNESQINFMLFVYDYEFFTLDKISTDYFTSKPQTAKKIIYPLQNAGYIYKYYDKLSPTGYEEAMFHENKFQYRVRYALTQKARLFVQKFYRKLEGQEQINVPTLL